ncbi:MAG: cytochrome c3 family protein [Planctomycetota bacterium]
MIFSSVIKVLRQLRWPVKVLLLIVLVALLSAGAVVITGQPGFCNSCHIMNTYYDSWRVSEHAHVNCLDCHLQPGFAGYAKGKINGLAQAVDCAVGRIGTKPNATVKDASCLRSECHSTEELVSKNIDYGDIKFTHQKHIDKVVDGIRISCGTCHSHFEGERHFSVNTEVCFTCHFLKSNESGSRVAKTSCQDCHGVPDKVIERGLVTINHAEFVAYKASCEDSCHKKEVEKPAQVTDGACLNCHSFSTDEHANSEELHEAHSKGEKVECFACHGRTSHGKTQASSVAVMMDCKNCHSDTHGAQRSIYTTEHPMQGEQTTRILGPMFLTHVECTGCHIEPVKKETGVLDSFGTVARAVPRACDNCHEKGTGEQYIPFWQGKIKALYEQVSQNVDKLEVKAERQARQQMIRTLYDKVQQARLILESVAADGSWGVHNFKYTEALLLRANEIANDAQ